jgi:hypothetical protein
MQLATAPLFACFELHPKVNSTTEKKTVGIQNCHKNGGRGNLIIFVSIAQD